MPYKDPVKKREASLRWSRSDNGRAYHRKYHEEVIKPKLAADEEYRDRKRDYAREYAQRYQERFREEALKTYARNVRKTAEAKAAIGCACLERDFRVLCICADGEVRCANCRRKAKVVRATSTKCEDVLRKRAWVRQIKTERGCRDCGERDPRALDFHHRDPSDKRTEVSRLAKYGWSALYAEVEKCDVVCANCHMREHSSEWKHLVDVVSHG